MRKLIFSVVIIVTLLLVAEIGVTLLSQKGMERALRNQYGLPPSLEVSINSFPFIVSLIRNHLGELALNWEDVLEYSAEEGVGEYVEYTAMVNLYDVELNMPSLLSGKLEVREISRARARLILDADAISSIMALEGTKISIEGDRMFLEEDGIRTQYKVKVVDLRTLILEPYAHSIGDKGYEENPYPPIKTIEISRLPMNGTLVMASINEGKVLVEISIPGWEGYM
jgi:LmeA-like phospholipid-binding